MRILHNVTAVFLLMAAVFLGSPYDVRAANTQDSIVMLPPVLQSGSSCLNVPAVGQPFLLAWDGRTTINCLNGLYAVTPPGTNTANLHITGVLSTDVYAIYAHQGITVDGGGRTPLGAIDSHGVVWGQGVTVAGKAAIANDGTLWGTGLTLNTTTTLGADGSSPTSPTNVAYINSQGSAYFAGDVAIGDTVIINNSTMNNKTVDAANSLRDMPNCPGGAITKTGATTFACASIPTANATLPKCASGQYLTSTDGTTYSCASPPPVTSGAKPLYVRSASTVGAAQWNNAMWWTYNNVCKPGVLAAGGDVNAGCDAYINGCLFDTSGNDGSGGSSADYTAKVSSVICQGWMCNAMTGVYASLVYPAGYCGPGQTPANSGNPSCNPDGKPLVAYNCLTTQ